MKIWTINIPNSKTSEPLDTSTHTVYIWQLFSALYAKGVPYSRSDFKEKRGFVAVVEHDYNKKRKADPTIGTKRLKAAFDEDVGEKFQKVLEDGTYKPWESMDDLLSIMAMELRRQFGVNRGTELSKLM